MERHLEFEDYVREERLPEKLKASLFQHLFRTRRRLKPERLSRSSRAVPNPSECKIVAQIVRGINIPVRQKDTANLSKTAEGSINVYVEVQFQRAKGRTSSQDSTNPQWNESVVLKFDPPNSDYRPESLQNVQDSIYLNLFDEFSVDLIRDEREREKKVYQRKERNWLGTVIVPFSALYQNVVVEGRFNVATPIVSFGYSQSQQSGNASSDVRLASATTMLELYITLEPALVQPPELVPKVCNTCETYMYYNTHRSV